jgi:hypothetical protein
MYVWLAQSEVTSGYYMQGLSVDFCSARHVDEGSSGYCVYVVIRGY